MPPKETPQQQLDRFLDAFTPPIAALARQVLSQMRRRYPTAYELVYDNYNALAIGFAPPRAPPMPSFRLPYTRAG